MTQLELDGISTDAEPLPDAAVAPATSGPAGEVLFPLLLSKGEDGVLRVEVDAKKGLRPGTYLFKFRYRTQLFAENKIYLRGNWAEVRWIGPRLQDGLDSARVLFRIPAASTAPKLPDVTEERGSRSVELEDTFLANLRRGAVKDELEIVRPHIAKGEPVLWRVLASPKAFDAFSSAPVAAAAVTSLPGQSKQELPRRELGWLLALVGVALGYAGLVYWKWRAFARVCHAESARARALIPLPAVLRALLAGIALAGACAVGLYAHWPTAAGALLVGSLALAALRGPSVIQPPRGPGRWLPIREEEAFAKPESPPGHWLDVGALKGALLFAVLGAALLVAAALLFRTRAYEGLLLALGATALLPIFFTGRARELPPDPALAPRSFLRWQAERLKKDASLRVVPWARVPELGSQLDELRLLVVPRRARTGLLALEIGLEYRAGGGGSIALPYVLVRALEGGAACEALPPQLSWTRGRKPEERVVVLQPSLPTRAGCRALLLEVLDRLRAPTARTTSKGPHSLSSWAMSAGKGASTAKAFKLESPVQLR